MENTERELIELILGIRSDDLRKSTLQEALRNGMVNNELRYDFVSLLLHLIALEQVGNLFCSPKNKSDKNGIVRALEEFFPKKFEKRELEGLKHLRHSLAHNYGLFIIDSREDIQKRNYKYLLFYYEDDCVIKKPDNEFDGVCKYDFVKRDKMNAQTSFQVYVPSLINLVRKIIYEVLPDKYGKGELKFYRKDPTLSEQEFFGHIATKYFTYTV